MAIKTDAMIAHNGADGYTLHIDYDPETDLFDLKAVFNDGSVKDIDGSLNPPALSSLSKVSAPDLIQSIDAEIETAEDTQPADPEPAAVKKTTRKAVK